MEQFDVLDCAGRKTGELISRDAAHQSGSWHGAFHCLIIYERGNRGYALFQQRSVQKKIAPGKYDVSVGGHYAAGEDAAIAGPREIREELGMEVAFSALVPLGLRVFVYCFSPGVRECEFQNVFLLPKEVNLQELVLQREEVDGLLEMEISSGIRFFSGQAGLTECTSRKPDGSLEQVNISPDQFVPCVDNYYLKLLVLAQRYFSGERNMLII